jgi:hypothetical protein
MTKAAAHGTAADSVADFKYADQQDAPPVDWLMRPPPHTVRSVRNPAVSREITQLGQVRPPASPPATPVPAGRRLAATAEARTDGSTAYLENGFRQ